ncbi:solute carrier organic anion transporter family member 74D isoform X2 [Scaptodrosophila lebanonensis]|nr:solute carrier organic anion transporter family member 74D isoform X2 [Scaptodrosophila lebanonensis]
MAFSYFNGTITTLERRFKIPAKTLGIISVGNDMSTMVASAFLGYYAGRRHRPRWMGCGILTLVAFCLLTAALHYFYGAGDEALRLTEEFGEGKVEEFTDEETLCNEMEPKCVKETGLRMPQLFLFAAQLVSGIGQALFYVLGVSYMDDNTTKSKTPAMLSWSTFIRMLGPAIGYSLASFCLRLYISPSLKPMIKNEDPRWLGAWWLGWLILAVVLLISALTIFMFPKELPKARMRRLKPDQDSSTKELQPLSLADLMKSVHRLLANKVFLYNTLASILYLFGYMAFWIFTPKYIEMQYRKSAATASLATGSVALAFSAAGVLISGFVISKYKPSARALAAWNGTVDFLTVAGILCYVFIGCEGSDRMALLSATSNTNCSTHCHCENVRYTPICGGNNITYLSACHAGCTEHYKDELIGSIYKGCDCMAVLEEPSISNGHSLQFQTGVEGACPVDCSSQFISFLVVMCFLKFVGASGRSSNVLLSLRCVPPEDKSFALGLGSMLVSLISFIPSPIFYGWIMDNHCLIWDKTCTNKGNCFLYDTKSLRYAFNISSAAFIFIGGFWNIGVWYHAKHLKIFDEESNTETKEKVKKKYMNNEDEVAEQRTLMELRQNNNS